MIFRGLAGLVAVAFGWVFLLNPQVGWDHAAIGLMFGLYALFGPKPAYWILWLMFGVPSKFEQKTGVGKKTGW